MACKYLAKKRIDIMPGKLRQKINDIKSLKIEVFKITNRILESG